MLAEFGTWWLQRMTELAAPVARAAAPGETLLLRPLAGAGVEALRQCRGRCQALGRFTLPDDAPLLRAARRRNETLALATAHPPLRRVATLPLAAERGLGELLRYEMDRLTPFQAADVLWDWRLAGRDRRRGTLAVELLLLPRAAVAAPLQAMEEAGLRADCVETVRPDGTPCRLPLDPPASHRDRRRQRAVYMLCAVLVPVCLGTPVLRQSLALRAQQAQIAALRPLVAEAQTLQRHISGTGDEDAPAAGRAHAADALTALAALTEALPDDTWLTKLGLNRRHLTMEGQTTGSATRLIAALAAGQRLRDPGFTAPTLTGDAGNELFALQVELAE